MKIRFKDLKEAFLDCLFPPRCVLCNEIVTPNRFFCRYCFDKIEFPIGERCLGCGLPAKSCDCDKFIYHFDGVISPYYNEGAAQSAVYKFKFEKEVRGAKFLAIQMAKSVREYYEDIPFSFVTNVCSSHKNPDFDHTKILTKYLSDELGIKMIEILEPTDKKRKVQHKQAFDLRFENVHGAYKAKNTCKGAIILLVDDIKTSGATIDECARQLKLAGAKAVYCITAVIGYNKT